jgi:hypothetical protein
MVVGAAGTFIPQVIGAAAPGNGAAAACGAF